MEQVAAVPLIWLLVHLVQALEHIQKYPQARQLLLSVD
jgi:hypothetical protein